MKSPIPIKPTCCCIRSTGNRAGSFLADMNGPGKESMKRKYKIAMVQMDTQNNKEKEPEGRLCLDRRGGGFGGGAGVLSRGHEPDREKHRTRREEGSRSPDIPPGGSWKRRRSMGSISMAAALRRRSRRKTGLQHQRAHRPRRRDSGQIQEAPYL